MGLNAFAGGLAKGFGQGVELGQKIDEGREKRKERRRQEELRERQQYAPIAGITDVPNVYDGQPVGMPEPPATQERGRSLFSKVGRWLNPEEAAASAGIPTQAAGLQVDGVQPQAAPAQPQAQPAGMPTGETTLGEVTVTPPAKRTATQRDVAVFNLREAMRRGDPALVQQAQAALAKAVTDEANGKIGSLMSWADIANAYEDQSGRRVDYKENPDGTASIMIDGEDAGTYSREQVRGNLMAMVNNNPAIAFEVSSKLRAEDRLELAARSDARYKANQMEIQRQNAEVAAYNAQTSRMTAENTVATSADERSEADAKTTYMKIMTGEAGDPLIRRYELRAAAQAGYRSVTNVVQDKAGNSQQVQTNPALEQADTETRLFLQRYQRSPYVQGGVLTRQVNPADGLEYYVVKGIEGGGFTNLAAAERAARAKYPSLGARPAAQAPAQQRK